LAILQSYTAGGKIFWLFPSDFSGSHNVMGPILYRNHFAVFVEVVLPIAVYEAIARHRESLRYSAAAAILYTSVIVSASRAGAAIATMEIVVVAWLVWRANRSSSRPAVPAMMKLGAVLSLFTVIAGWSALSKRLEDTNPFHMRREFTLSSIQMVSSHPLTGVGLGNWPVVYPRYAVTDFGVFANRAHSDWLEWTAEGGIPLGLAMLTLLVWAVRPAIRSVWGMGVLAVFVHAAVDYPFSRPALGAWITIVIAMLAAINCHSIANSNIKTTNSSHPARVA
jgi:O-antigen ligase